MKRKRFSVEQIVAVLKQAEIGVPVAELIRQVGITEQTLETSGQTGNFGTDGGNFGTDGTFH